MKRRNFFKVIPVLAVTPLVVIKAFEKKEPRFWVDRSALLKERIFGVDMLYIDTPYGRMNLVKHPLLDWSTKGNKP